MGTLLVRKKNGYGNPWHGLGPAVSDMESILDSFLRGFDIQPYAERREKAFTPRIDVTENGKEIVISAELPGMEEKDSEVILENEFLTIKGEKKDEKVSDENGRYHSERTYGAFSRTIQLPEGFDGDNIRARYRNGVLTVTVPKAEKAAEAKKTIKIEG